MTVLPEQAASWAYPQPGMTSEEVAFCLVTGLLGRFFLSGYLNKMSDSELALVAEAVGVAKALSGDIASAVPFWPLGLPKWDDAWVALGLRIGCTHYISLWNRTVDAPETSLSFHGHPAIASGAVDTIFPRSLPGWQTRWDEESGTLHVLNPTRSVGARVFRITATDLASTTSSNTIP
jgi:alpha-galactosidase